MIKIDKFLVKHFKNIENADVTLGFLNVLIGPNGSGKSNFLLITSFLDAIINGSSESVKRLLESGFSGRFRNFYTQRSFVQGKQEATSFKNIEIGVEFSDSILNYIYRYDIIISPKDETDKDTTFQIHSELFTYKFRHQKGKSIQLMSQKDGLVTINKSISSGFTDRKITDFYTSGVKILDIMFKTSSDLNNKYGHTLAALNSILKTKTVYLSSHAMKHYDSDFVEGVEGRLVKFNLEDQIKNIYETEKWNDFLEAVRSVTNISNILVVKPEGIDKLLRDESFVAYLFTSRIGFLADLSDGEILLIGLINQIVTDTRDIIFFEEIENSVHPKALENLIELMNTNHNDKQFLISTHSTTLLNMVKPENVLIATINDNKLAEITMIPDVKEMRRKLSKGFLSFGDLLYQVNDEEFEDIF